MSGWIKLHRQIKEHWIWQDPNKLKWWITLLLEMNHSVNKVNIGNQLFEVSPGQSVKSLQTWASIFGTSKDAVRNFFKLLEKDGMIKIENLQKTTRITVCNYDSYQTNLHDNQTQTKRKPNANQTQTHPNKNEEEGIKNDKEELFDKFWDEYDKKVGDKDKIKIKFLKLMQSDIDKIFEHIPKYKISQPDKKFRKDPSTYLNNKSWNDEIISNNLFSQNIEQPKGAAYTRQFKAE